MSDAPSNRRKFFMHAAHRSIGVSGGFSAAKATDVTGEFHWEAESPLPVRVCLLTGASLKAELAPFAILCEYLEASGLGECERASWAVGEGPSLKNLESAEFAILWTDGRTMAGDPPEAIRQYLAAGKPILVLGKESHRLHDWLSGTLSGDAAVDAKAEALIEIAPAPAADGHPLLEGVGPFVAHGEFGSCLTGSDSLILLHGSAAGRCVPVAWTQPFDRASVVGTALGSRADFENPSFLRLLANAIRWAASRGAGC